MNKLNSVDSEFIVDFKSNRFNSVDSEFLNDFKPSTSINNQYNNQINPQEINTNQRLKNITDMNDT